MKKYFSFILIILSFLTFSFNISNNTVYSLDENKTVNVYIFYNEECSTCHEAIEYLDELENDYSGKINFYKLEYFYNEDNETKFNYIRNHPDEFIPIEGNSVPFIIVGNTSFSGFNKTIEYNLKSSIDYYRTHSYIDKLASYLNVSNDHSTLNEGEIDNYYVIKNELIDFFGHTIYIKDFSLPLIATLIGIVDGFNPCAMWILLFLITMLINTKDRKKMWILGFTFILTSAIVYLLFMILWLNLVVQVSTILWLRYFIATIALTAGIYNLYVFIKTFKDKGCHIIDKDKRKKLFSKVNKILDQNTSFIMAMIGIITLAASVNIIELACSAGLPLVFTQILAINDLNIFQQILYFGIYIFFFLLDDLVVFIIAMFTFKIVGTSNKYGKISQLVGGLILILVGILMIFKPEWLMFNF